MKKIELPCHKYILRYRLDDKNLEFVRNYLLAHISIGEQDVNMLCAALQETIKDKPYPETKNALSMVLDGGNPDRFVWELGKGVSAHSCMDYYKSIDPQMPACDFCPYCAANANDLIETEFALIRSYVLDPQENDAILLMEIDDQMFRSVIDVAGPHARRPKPFYLAREIWGFVTVNEEMASDSNQMRIERIKKHVYQQLSDQDDSDNFNEALAKYLLTGKVYKYNEVCGFYSQLVGRKKAPQNEEAKESCIIYRLPAGMAEKHKEFECEAEEKRQAEIQRNKREQQEAEDERHQKENKVHDSQDKSVHQQFHYSQVQFCRTEVPKHPENWEIMPYRDSRIVLPIASMEEVSRFMDDIDTQEWALKKLIDGFKAAQNRQTKYWLAVEAVNTDFGGRLVMYDVAHCRHYYTEACKMESFAAMQMILGNEMTEVVCYMPYILVPTLRQKGIMIKNLYSIYSLSAVIEPRHTLPMWKVLEQYGACDWGYFQDYLYSNDASTVMRYLHCYKEIIGNVGSEIKQLRKTEDAMLQCSCDITLSHFFDIMTGEPFRVKSAGDYDYSGELDIPTGNHAWRVKIIRPYEYGTGIMAVVKVLRMLLQNEILRTTNWSVQCIQRDGFVIVVSTDDVKSTKGLIQKALSKRKHALKGIKYKLELMS